MGDMGHLITLRLLENRKINQQREIREHKKWLRFVDYIGKEWAKCKTRGVGAVLIKDKRILSTGYCGTPKGFKNCNEGGCERCNDVNVKSGERLEECYCVHAEMNAIFNAAYHGICIKDSTLYLPCNPCLTCAKGIFNSVIKELYFKDEYSNCLKEVEKLFKITNIKLKQIK